MKRELTIPPDANLAEEAVELFRGRIIDQKLQCSIFPSIWKDNPGTWGILLADVARHISSAVENEFGIDKRETLEEIKRVLDQEWLSEWDEYEGDFIENPSNA